MMKKIQLHIGVLIGILLAIASTSCRKIVVEVLVKDKSAIKKRKILIKDDKEIIYVPMVHIGSNKYYLEINEFIKEKRNEGYIVFYEGVKYGIGLTEEEKKIVDLKLRRLIGFHLTNLNESENKSLPKHANQSKSIYQTLENVGIDTLKDINADLTRMELVELYESEYGEVYLDSCDFNTPLFYKYNCSKGLSYYKVVYTYRENALIDKLLASNNDKIVLLFGKSHWIKSIYPVLVHQNGFDLVHGKI